MSVECPLSSLHGDENLLLLADKPAVAVGNARIEVDPELLAAFKCVNHPPTVVMVVAYQVQL